MKNQFITTGLLIVTLLFEGCSFFVTEKSSVERKTASALEQKILEEKGLYPESLKGRSEIIPDKLYVFFNLPPYTNPGGIGLIPAMIDHINKARTSIKMAVFQFNHAGVFEALKKAAARKVKIYISTDLCYSGKVGYKEYFEDLKKALIANGQLATQIQDDGTVSCEAMFNHNKYMIFDDEIAWFGSFNPTNHGSVENVELAISLKDENAVRALNLDFEQLLIGKYKVAKKGVYSVIEKGASSVRALDENEIKSLVMSGAKVTYPTVTAEDHSFEFILSPKVKSLTRIVEEIYASKNEILFSSFAIADQMLIGSIINKFQGVNKNPILLLPHPGEVPSVVIRDGDGEHSQEIALTSRKSVMDNFKNDLNRTLPAAKNYQTPKGELKGIFRYFYPMNSKTSPTKVHVEGIFNNKVIEAESTRDRMAKVGIPLSQSNLNGELHNKLFIIDENVTIFGSHNFSQSAENSNDELTVIIKSNKIASFLKNELYRKTKLFSIPRLEEVRPVRLAITEILSDSSFKFKQVNRIIDSGDYIELYNYGSTSINVMGFRIDDRYFPKTDKEAVEMATNPGFSGELVGFRPSEKVGELGLALYDSSRTIINPNQTALIVGKYFQESYYRKKFEENFKKINKRDPKKDEYPVLLTIGAYYSSVIGDSTNGLKPKDKLSLYHIDNHTVVDRFEFPVETMPIDTSLERKVDRERLNDEFDARANSLDEFNHDFSLKNNQRFTDSFYGVDSGYSKSTDWEKGISVGGTPGIVSANFKSRDVASIPNIIVVQGEIADATVNKFTNGFIIIQGGKIKEVITGTNLPANYPAPVLKDQLIFPGLIDGHNHLKYNFFPLWITNKFFNNRYEWPELSVYTKGIKDVYKKVYIEIPECKAKKSENEQNKCYALERCHVLRFGEIKALLGGTTAIQGSTSFDETSSDITFRGLTSYFTGSGKKRIVSKARLLEDMLDSCSQDGAQNIERIKIQNEDLVRSTAVGINDAAFGTNQIGKSAFKSTASGKLAEEYLNTQSFVADKNDSWKEKTRAFYVHLAEGIDQSSKDEWAMLAKLGLDKPQSVIIHGLGLGPNELAAMKKSGSPLIWSPTSNALLYKNVAKIPEAKSLGITIGLGSDWSLSGTRSMLYELKVASDINQKLFSNKLSAQDLFLMATKNNAKISGYEGYLGAIETGASADFFLVESKNKKSNPADTLLSLTEANIDSTWVKGIPQTGNIQKLDELNKDLDLDLEVLDLFAYDGKSCGTKLGVLTTKENVLGFDRVIARYKKAVNELNPKLKAELGPEFLNTDYFCQERESRAIDLTKKALGI